jgi:O-antigen ligase
MKESSGPALKALTCFLIVVLVGVPLAHSSLFLHSYSVPKFVILLIASVLMAGALAWLFCDTRRLRSARGPFALLVSGYVIALGISTALGVSPLISAQGSFQTFTGFSAYTCFAIVAVGVWVAAGQDLANFKRLLKAITIAGFLAATVGVGQFTGIIETDPAAAATFGDPSRIYATLGHPDFAGNFLLYIAFASEATALLSRKSRWQTVAGATAVIALIALVFTGTRGAWLGLIAGVVAGTAIALRQRVIKLPSRKVLVRAAMAGALLIAIVALGIKYTSIGAPIRNRFAMTVHDRLTGSGRTTDWKLALRMLRKYWLTGCGLDSFRLAQLPFKTDEYARGTAGVDAEDPHSAFLSSLVSTGLIGFLLYGALICFAIHCYWRAIRNSTDRDQRAAGIVLLSGMVAVLIHDLILHHVVSTGVYFFVFLALGPAWARLQDEGGFEAAGKGRLSKLEGSSLVSRKPRLAVRGSILAITALLLTAAIGYSYRLLRAEYYIVKCLSAASTSDSESTISNGVRATEARLYQTDLDFYYAGALERLLAAERSARQKQGRQDSAESRLELFELAPESQRLLGLAVDSMSRATVRTLTPVTNLAALALLKIKIRDFDGASEAINRAQQLDPHSYLPHLAWSTLYLRQKDLDRSVDEFNAARLEGAPGANLVQLRHRLADAARRAKSSALLQELTDDFSKEVTN